MHFYRVFWIWGDFCKHFYRVCWIPLMGMSCFLVQNCTHFTKVSCFSVHFCSRLSPISCFACFFACFCTSVCDSVLMCCSLWQGVLESSWYFNAILRCVLWAVYGNVVFFRWKVDAHHKSLMFFRPFLSPAVAKPMFCVYWFAYFAAGFSEYEVTFAWIFTGFAEARLWECRVFSFKIARAS